MVLAAGDRHQQIKHMLNHCESFTEKLSDWEVQFIASIADQIQRRGDLTDKQVDILERIYCKLP